MISSESLLMYDFDFRPNFGPRPMSKSSFKTFF